MVIQTKIEKTSHQSQNKYVSKQEFEEVKIVISEMDEKLEHIGVFNEGIKSAI